MPPPRPPCRQCCMEREGGAAARRAERSDAGQACVVNWQGTLSCCRPEPASAGSRGHCSVMQRSLFLLNAPPHVVHECDASAERMRRCRLERGAPLLGCQCRNAIRHQPHGGVSQQAAGRSVAAPQDGAAWRVRAAAVNACQPQGRRVCQAHVGVMAQQERGGAAGGCRQQGRRGSKRGREHMQPPASCPSALRSACTWHLTRIDPVSAGHLAATAVALVPAGAHQPLARAQRGGGGAHSRHQPVAAAGGCQVEARERQAARDEVEVSIDQPRHDVRPLQVHRSRRRRGRRSRTHKRKPPRGFVDSKGLGGRRICIARPHSGVGVQDERWGSLWAAVGQVEARGIAGAKALQWAAAAAMAAAVAAGGAPPQACATLCRASSASRDLTRGHTPSLAPGTRAKWGQNAANRPHNKLKISAALLSSMAALTAIVQWQMGRRSAFLELRQVSFEASASFSASSPSAALQTSPSRHRDHRGGPPRSLRRRSLLRLAIQPPAPPPALIHDEPRGHQAGGGAGAGGGAPGRPGGLPPAGAAELEAQDGGQGAGRAGQAAVGYACPARGQAAAAAAASQRQLRAGRCRRRRLLQESHASSVHTLVVNHTAEDLGNLFATVGKDQATGEACAGCGQGRAPRAGAASRLAIAVPAQPAAPILAPPRTAVW